MGRALEMTVPNSVPGQPPQKHDFAFDRVFAPNVGQVLCSSRALQPLSACSLAGSMSCPVLSLLSVRSALKYHIQICD